MNYLKTFLWSYLSSFLVALGFCLCYPVSPAVVFAAMWAFGFSLTWVCLDLMNDKLTPVIDRWVTEHRNK